MALLWTDDLNTGIEVIDEQHMRIVDYINQMANPNAQDRLIVEQVLDDLVDYTLSHFAFEESLQEEAGYRFTKQHKAIHDTFARRIAKYKERHGAGDDVAKPIHDMLSAWLVHHIKREDMNYVTEAKSNIMHIVDDKQEAGWVSRALGRFFK